MIRSSFLQMLRAALILLLLPTVLLGCAQVARPLAWERVDVPRWGRTEVPFRVSRAGPVRVTVRGDDEVNLFIRRAGTKSDIAALRGLDVENHVARAELAPGAYTAVVENENWLTGKETTVVVEELPRSGSVWPWIGGVAAGGILLAFILVGVRSSRRPTGRIQIPRSPPRSAPEPRLIPRRARTRSRRRVQLGRLEVQTEARGTCGYCKASLGGARIVNCRACRTPHHRECWDENGECTMFGCAGSDAYTPRRRVRVSDN